MREKNKKSISYELKYNFDSISFKMVTDAKLLLGLSFDPVDVDSKTIVMDKPEIFVDLRTGKPIVTGTGESKDKGLDKPKADKIPGKVGSDIKNE